VSGTTTPRVRVYTRPGCHLCEEALAVVAAVCAELDEQWDEVDVTTDEALLERYHDEIPVTLVDGAQHDFWRVDPARLRAALRAGAGGDAAASPEEPETRPGRWPWSRKGRPTLPR
jgi:hypothetical protein